MQGLALTLLAAVAFFAATVEGHRYRGPRFINLGITGILAPVNAGYDRDTLSSLSTFNRISGSSLTSSGSTFLSGGLSRSDSIGVSSVYPITRRTEVFRSFGPLSGGFQAYSDVGEGPYANLGDSIGTGPYSGLNALRGSGLGTDTGPLGGVGPYDLSGPNDGPGPYGGPEPYDGPGPYGDPDPYDGPGPYGGPEPYDVSGTYDRPGLGPIDGVGPLSGSVPYDGVGPLSGSVPYDGVGPLSGSVPYDGVGPLSGSRPYDGVGPLSGSVPYDGVGPLSGSGPYDGVGPLSGSGPYDGVGFGNGALSGSSGGFTSYSERYSGSYPGPFGYEAGVSGPVGGIGGRIGFSSVSVNEPYYGPSGSGIGGIYQDTDAYFGDSGVLPISGGGIGVGSGFGNVGGLTTIRTSRYASYPGAVYTNPYYNRLDYDLYDRRFSGGSGFSQFDGVGAGGSLNFAGAAGGSAGIRGGVSAGQSLGGQLAGGQGSIGGDPYLSANY